MTFPLAGLLRVRGAQERVAAEQLSRASAERVDAETATQHAVSSLADISAQVDDPSTLMAMAAARAAGRSTLSDLQALVEMRRRSESEAKSAHVDARRELKGLERLESTHRAEAAKSELAAEQSALDEIAVVRSSRREGSAA
ncbi:MULTISPECIES: flagellar FliJ family protein [Microbacterium]|uniref:Flagellar FliJ protein n=1 Tax=Microbacterium hydrocarbonoxydans TaxID=273678 RepID=A0A1H4LM01_9MICO|nr:flagellar FliJ family protein [Microbacterium hydrocarbonoxydans]SEB71302.1 FliJ protein [Microbacterium hydrocarbonoxydans]